MTHPHFEFLELYNHLRNEHLLLRNTLQGRNLERLRRFHDHEHETIFNLPHNHEDEDLPLEFIDERG